MRRFIPVYTGNTMRSITQFKAFPVYPCVYREHPSVLYRVDFLPGLSLCIQGTLEFGQLLEKKARFIPVYTGNTNDNCLEFINFTVYPCVYREHSKYI